MYIIYALLAFSLLIIVHELGHFVMAKVNGIKVNEFAIGMGPQLFKIQGKETVYSLRLFPIGGYVQMHGEEEEIEDERSFSSKSPLRRISVIVAGVIMNMLLALIIFTAFFNKFGFALNTVDTVVSGSPAQSVGLQQGDEFLEVNGAKIRTPDDLKVEIILSKGAPLDLTINRNGEKKNVTVAAKPDENGNYLIGISYIKNVNPTIIESAKAAVNQSISLISQTFKGLKTIITGEANFKTDVGGPVTIIKMSAVSAKNGFWNLIYFTAFISVNLAVFNLLPFPALDGGWTIILLIELITGKKVPSKIVETINTVGIMILFGFMIIVTIKDILFPITF